MWSTQTGHHNQTHPPSFLSLLKYETPKSNPTTNITRNNCKPCWPATNFHHGFFLPMRLCQSSRGKSPASSQNLLTSSFGPKEEREIKIAWYRLNLGIFEELTSDSRHQMITIIAIFGLLNPSLYEKMWNTDVHALGRSSDQSVQPSFRPFSDLSIYLSHPLFPSKCISISPQSSYQFDRIYPHIILS